MTDDTNTDNELDAITEENDRLSDPLNFDPPDKWTDWWLPPTGHGVARVIMAYSKPDRANEFLEEHGDVNWPVGDPDFGTKLHSRADQRPIREFAALLDAYHGHVPVPDGHPSDEHPLDALYALRAVRKCVCNLHGHPFVEPDSTVVDALMAAERDIRAAEAKYERTCNRAGLPTDAESGSGAIEESEE